MILKKFNSIKKINNGYYIYGDCADIKLIFLTDDIIRIRVSFEKKFIEESYALVTTAWEDRFDKLLEKERKRITSLDIPYEENDDFLVFKTKTLKLVMNKNPLYFRLYDKDGTLIYSDLPERAFDKDQLGRLSHYSCINFDKDHFYGFGEKTGYLDKKGRRMRMCPKDAIGQDPENGDPLYKHIPFYIRINEDVQKAVGLYYNNSYDSVFDMGNEISGYWRRYCYYQTDGGDIDLFLMNGPTISQILDHYTMLTGRSALPTKQSLGYTSSAMYYAELSKNCDQELFNVIDKHFKENLYIDNVWLSSGYSSGEEDNLRYVFNWNHRRFPHPEEFCKKMKEKGINLIPNLKPGILKNHPYMKYLKENDVFIKTPDGTEDYIGRWWGGAGRFFDFTNPKGRDTWKKLLEEKILSKGVKTVWNDNCEYDGIEDRNAQCDFEGKKGTMAQLKIIQSNMMAYTGKQALAEMYPNERPYIINRAGFSGIQRYAQVWAGDNLTDWRTLKFNIATLVGMGLSGLANVGCDIGGFAGNAPSGELLLRWIQNGIFQPRFCINSANADNTVTQPWMYEENLSYVQEAYAQRYRMLPYLYSLMYIAHSTGKPVMRPLFMEFMHDKKCYSDKNLTFMFGDAVLVANVVEPNAKSRTIYLPEGCIWYDMNDNLYPYEGGQTIEIPVNKASIPMFLRGNSIYFTSEDVHHILSDELHTLDFLISTDADSESVFYDDDGHTKDFEDGVYAKTTIKVKSGNRKVISFHREGSYKSTVTNLTLRVVSKDKGAFWVTVDGHEIVRYIIKDNWNKATEGWYYNLSERTVNVKCALPQKTDFEIVVSTEQFDLIGMSKD